MCPQVSLLCDTAFLQGSSSSGVYDLCVSCLMDIYFATVGRLSVSSYGGTMLVCGWNVTANSFFP